MNRAFVFLTMVVVVLGTAVGCSSPETFGGNAATSSNRSIIAGPFTSHHPDNIDNRVFFATNRYDITPENRDLLEKQAAWLKQYTKYAVTIEGHCDERGSREYNMALGERRAQAVKNYLVRLGVSADRIKTISYGKERPIALGHDEDAWKQNRLAITVLK